MAVVVHDQLADITQPYFGQSRINLSDVSMTTRIVYQMNLGDTNERSNCIATKPVHVVL